MFSLKPNPCQIQVVANNSEIDKRLWSAADEPRANSK
jgi:hypothetical protein